MLKVQFRDAEDHERVLVNDIRLNFDPRLSAYLRLRDKPTDFKTRLFQVVADQGIAEVVTDDPDQSGIVVFLKEIRR